MLGEMTGRYCLTRIILLFPERETMRRLSLIAAEHWALLATLFFLPAIEAPKKIAVVLYLLFWVLNRWPTRAWGGAWSIWESTLLALIGGAYASTQWGAFTPGKGLFAANDVLIYGLVFLAVRRARYADALLWRALVLAIVGTLLTLAHGYWGLYVTGKRETLGLVSVGHVNHSAIYMAIVFAAAFAGLLSIWRSQSRLRWAVAGAVAVLWVSLFITEARGAIIPAVLIACCLPVLILRGQGMNRALLLLLPLTMCAAVLLVAPTVIEKTRAHSEKGTLGSYRPALARTALVAFGEYPVFGVGATTFGRINPELTASWQARNGEWFEPDSLFYASHAHSLYANTLAERGLVGFLPLLVFLSLCGLYLFRGRHLVVDAGDSLGRTLWGGAAGAWWVTVLGGFLNTTFHHEHALITVIFIALWLSYEHSRYPHGQHR